jgi:hypothetical protein
MANHLTPDDLAKEVGIARDEVIRICLEEHVPIYQGKIDKSLFSAQLSALGALPARHERRAAAGYLREAAARVRGAAFCFFAAGCFFDAAATDARSASMRSITGVGATGSGTWISCP